MWSLPQGEDEIVEVVLNWENVFIVKSEQKWMSQWMKFCIIINEHQISCDMYKNVISMDGWIEEI